jgi:hypothetical protein
MRKEHHKRKTLYLRTAIDPVVLRTFRRTCRRLGFCHDGTGRDGVLQRMLVCWLRSDAVNRCDVVYAGRYDPDEKIHQRHKRIAKIADDLQTDHAIAYRQKVRGVQV